MKILIIKTSSLGDIIHAFTTVQYLRSKFPSAQIDWVVEKPFAEIVKAHPAVNNVYCVDTKAWRKRFFNREHIAQIRSFVKNLRGHHYDVAFDLQGNSKSGLICFMTRAKAKVGFGSKTVSEWPNRLFTNQTFDPPPGNNIRSDNLFLAQSFFKDLFPFKDRGVLLKIQPEQQLYIQKILESLNGKKAKVMVCPGSAWKNKQVTREALADFLKRLQQHLDCYFLFIWGTPDEKKWVMELQALFSDTSVVLDRMPLPVLQNLMDKMDQVIAMDSLPLHLAGTTSVSTFSVFGPSLSAKYKPEGVQHLSLQGICPYGRTFVKRCPILRTCPTGSCIRDLSGQAIFDANNKNKTG